MTPEPEVLKIWPEFFQDVIEGRKVFEVRENDRPYSIGYRFVLGEWDPTARAFTGRTFGPRRITYLTDFGLKPGFVAFAHEDDPEVGHG